MPALKAGQKILLNNSRTNKEKTCSGSGHTNEKKTSRESSFRFVLILTPAIAYHAAVHSKPITFLIHCTFATDTEEKTKNKDTNYLLYGKAYFFIT